MGDRCVMSMVITCGSCNSRFRFDEGLLKGAKGALIKCPRCSERILVRNPAAPRVMPSAASLDVSLGTTPIVPRISPPVSTSKEISFFPAADPDSASPEIPGKQAQRVADLFRSPSEAEADRDLSWEDDSTMEDREVGPAWRIPPVRPLYQRPLFIAAAISVLLLSGGAFYYVDGSFSRKPSVRVFPVQAQRPSGQSVFDVQNLKGHLNKQATGERLYVIKGTVTNVGKTVSNGIRIQATLLGVDNQSIMKNEAFAGNLIDDSLISYMNRVRIEGFLGMRYGEGNANRDIPVGMSLPFMVVFFDPPEGIQSFTVKAMDVDEAEKIRSSDMEKMDTRDTMDTRVSTQQSIRQN
jgi:predicted Zn finger-like uncharacterized protein